MALVKMRVWDVQHGNAIFVRTPNHKNLVFDLGRGDYSEYNEFRSPLDTLYNHYKIRTIDYLLITHPHKDHIDDILNLEKFFVSVFNHPKSVKRDEIMHGVSERDRPKFEKYFQMADRYTLAIAGTNEDTAVPENYGGVKMDFFTTPSLPTSNLNNHSILTVLDYEGLKVVIPGDNEYASIDLLMNEKKFRDAVTDCAILIAPHHGRESAYHNDFVSLANPRITIISDGSICDTSANSKYSSKTRGWAVWKDGQKTTRKLLTTNYDGEIYLDFGTEDGNRLLQVVLK